MDKEERRFPLRAFKLERGALVSVTLTLELAGYTSAPFLSKKVQQHESALPFSL